MTTLMSYRTLPTVELKQAGQSPWLDTISRELLRSGRLRRMIQEEGLLGVTSNPSIFEKAIGQQDRGYEAVIRKMARQGRGVFEIYDALTVKDIQDACDLFAPVFRDSGGEHGFVSLEVMPSLAANTEATLREARRLFKKVARPNVMIKVPATPEGIPAIRQLISEGINVNITLIFSLQHYLEVAQAYIEGLEALKARRGNLARVHSVASVFVSRIDTLLDKKLSALAMETLDESRRQTVEQLKGKAAIANSRLIYLEFQRLFGSPRFSRLAKSGATIQKVLWGSTSTKNPAYPDLIYVETLVGPETVNTMPLATYEAFLDHGQVKPLTIEEDVEQAGAVLRSLELAGFRLQDIGDILQREGVRSFMDSFDTLMRTLETARERFIAPAKTGSTRTAVFLPPAKNIQEGLSRRLAGWESKGFLEKFLKGDPQLWKAEPAHQEVVRRRFGWLRAHDWMSAKLGDLELLEAAVRQEKITDVVLLGMGGSSLAPEVMSLVCPRSRKTPRFFMLDTTDPAAILRVRRAIRLKSTLFVVASKSGSTIETSSQYRYFYAQVAQAHGRAAAPAEIGRQFIAITDEGSALQKLAVEKQFREIYINPSDIGGRYSALSYFGLIPAALLGIDFRGLLRSARQVFEQTEKHGPLTKNPAVYLGAALAELARHHKNKLTFISTPRLASFSAWVEQLVAESTGKEGKGILPVEGELPGAPKTYLQDRVFVFQRLEKEKPDASYLRALKDLRAADFAVIEFVWPDGLALGGEFLRWEIATAVASAALEINPFDEPNVTESKINTGKLLEELARTRKFSGAKAFVPVRSHKGTGRFFSKLAAGGYIVFLAYLERSAENIRLLNRLRETVRQALKVPVLVGFGPRYLHSIGQLYKGGPRTGLFIEFVVRDAQDLDVPGAGYRFGQLKMAQALGDLQALQSKDLPVLTLDLGINPAKAIAEFEAQFNRWTRQRRS